MTFNDSHIPDEKEIKEFQECLLNSKHSLSVYAVFMAGFCILLFVVSRFVHVPVQAAVILVGISGISVVSKAVDIAYISRKLQNHGFDGTRVNGSVLDIKTRPQFSLRTMFAVVTIMGLLFMLLTSPSGFSIVAACGMVIAGVLIVVTLLAV